MDFKKKFKSFLNEIKESSARAPDVEETLPSLLVESPAVAKFKEHLAVGESDPTKETEVLESIEDNYYQHSASFDSSRYELKKMVDPAQIPDIDQERKKLKRQLEAVSRKVSETVLENHPAYATELDRVMELQRSLQQAMVVCANGRRKLGDARESFTEAGLGLLSNYRKRQQLMSLLKALSTIKTLQRTDVRLREMLEEEEYSEAIQLCFECQKVASTLKHYHCISELSTKLQDTLELIEESLDVALSKTCHGFDEKHYSKVQAGYKLLAKTQMAMDQLHMHFTTAIHITAFQIVLGYVELVRGDGESHFQKKNYTDLCKLITPEMFTACLVDLCKALWGVMTSYFSTMQWHEHHLDMEKPDSDSEPQNQEASINRHYIRSKLEHGLVRVWGDVQAKVKLYILSTDLSHFQYDQFIQVLDVINRLMKVGQEFCGSQSEGLQESVRKQSLAYFKNYHRTRLDELRIFLESEAWELCPVKSNFSVLMLQEFKFLRTCNNLSSNQDDGDTGNEKSAVGYFKKYLDSGTPFDLEAEEEHTEDLFDTSTEQSGRILSQDTDSDDEIADELKQDYVDEQTGESPIRKTPTYQRVKSRDRSNPIVTNTTLNVCRLFGKYLQMMTVLKPIAFDVIICMSQLFDYYLFTVYSFFIAAETEDDAHMTLLSNKLRATLKRIHENLIVDDIGDSFHEQDQLSPVSVTDKVLKPHLSPVVNLRGRDGLQGLSERVVATESLVFLASQFQFLQQHLEAVIPTSKRAFLQQFYSQTISTANELRGPVYHSVAARSISTEQMYTIMSTIKFDIKDIMSQHSPYVDVILKELTQFAVRVEHISKRVPIPTAVNDEIWLNCITIVNAVFVDGFASAKKCTNEGRALMQLDFQQFLLLLEKLTQLRPIPGREYVEGYIKAYYLPEAQLELWLREHKEYTGKQLISLVNTIPHINRKTKQRLISVIEDFDRTRKL